LQESGSDDKIEDYYLMETNKFLKIKEKEK